VSQLLLDGTPLKGVTWSAGAAKFTLPKTNPHGGGPWAPNHPVHVQVVVNGQASKPIVLVVGPPPQLHG
jgi:hypothetical protein